MPYQNTWEERGFYSKFWGIVPEWEIAAMNQDFSNDPRCDVTHYQIFDGTEIDAFVISDQQINHVASNDIGLSSYLKNISVALVGSKPDIRVAYLQYIETCKRFNTTWRFQIFDTLDEAREWLATSEQDY